MNNLPTISLSIDVSPFIFYRIEQGFIFSEEQINQDSSLIIGERVPISGMFSVNRLLLNARKIGYYFTSQFQTINNGAFILTFLNNKAGKANSVEVLVKTPKLVIYNFPNCGTLIVSPSISSAIETILSEQ